MHPTLERIGEIKFARVASRLDLACMMGRSDVLLDADAIVSPRYMESAVDTIQSLIFARSQSVHTKYASLHADGSYERPFQRARTDDIGPNSSTITWHHNGHGGHKKPIQLPGSVAEAYVKRISSASRQLEAEKCDRDFAWASPRQSSVKTHTPTSSMKPIIGVKASDSDPWAHQPALIREPTVYKPTAWSSVPPSVWVPEIKW